MELFRAKWGKAVYMYTKDGEKQTLTRADFREMYPDEWPPTYTLEAARCKAVAYVIRRRISKRFWDHEALKKKRMAEKKAGKEQTLLKELKNCSP